MPREPVGSADEAPDETDVDEESEESFPASDPPSHWGGGSQAGGDG